MSGSDDSAPLTPVLDLAPRLAKKRAAECAHPNCEVDMNAASLSCCACGAELDPWWFLRRMAADEESERASKVAAAERYNAWIEGANRTVTRLSNEISHLTAVKNRLWNTRVDGQLLGVAASRRRRKTPRTESA